MSDNEVSLIEWQQAQFSHDQRNHSDIICLHRNDRLKHYGLHFAKYVGRLARGPDEEKPVSSTVTDCALVCLSAANALAQKLEYHPSARRISHTDSPNDLLADAAGRFCDACEKIDHLEPFLDQARLANQDILTWVINYSEILQLDLQDLIDNRRRELKARQFFIAG